MSKKPYQVVWDIETTGLDPKKDVITEIGCLILRDGEEPEERSWLLNHKDIEIQPFITELTGIDKALLESEGVDPETAIFEFWQLILGAFANVSHNGIRFDIPFFAEQCAKIAIEYAVERLGDHDKVFLSKLQDLFVVQYIKMLEDGAVDTAAEFKARVTGLKPEKNEPYAAYVNRVLDYKSNQFRYSLDYCLQASGIKHNMRRHRAMPDVKLTAELYNYLNKDYA